jgi:methionyl-tRNA formyltransferase
VRLVIAGAKLFGAQIVRSLHGAGFELLGVTSPDSVRPGTGHQRDRVREVAEELGIPWRPTPDMPELGDADLMIAAHYQKMIPTRLLDKVPLAIGYHPSLLPRHRGPDAIRWALACGDSITGGSVYQLTGTVDGGPLLGQESVTIQPGDTAESLWRRDLFPLGITMLSRAVDQIVSGSVVFTPQDSAAATYESWFPPPDAPAKNPADLAVAPRG